MLTAKQLAMGIITTILIPTIPAILAGIIHNAIQPQISPPQPPLIEKKDRPPAPNPPPIVIIVPPADSPASQALTAQLVAQKAKIDALAKLIEKLKRDADCPIGTKIKPPDGIPPLSPGPKSQGKAVPSTKVSSPAPASETKIAALLNLAPPSIPPEPKPVFLYYRVPAQRCRQVEYSQIDEVTAYLRSLHISYVRGREYKDSGLSPLRVPLALKPISWTCYRVRSASHRDRVVTKMQGFGIETTTEKPEEIDD